MVKIGTKDKPGGGTDPEPAGGELVIVEAAEGMRQWDTRH